MVGNKRSVHAMMSVYIGDVGNEGIYFGEDVVRVSWPLTGPQCHLGTITTTLNMLTSSSHS